MISFVAAPKPFRGEISEIQFNAVRSWTAVDPSVEVILVGDEEGVAEAAAETGARWAGPAERNDAGTPLVRSVFDLGTSEARSPLICYINADIVLLDDFLPAVKRVRMKIEQFVMVGARWDLDVEGPLSFSAGWRDRLREEVRVRGRRHPAMGSDYFVYPRESKFEMPAFALGRAGWDNWMIYYGRQRRWPVVDATAVTTVIHQNHDYGHLPGGRPHHRLPESDENVRLAGGRRAIFTLRDADWVLPEAGPPRRRGGLRRWVREAEIFPLLVLRSRSLAQAAYVLLNPRKAWGELRGWAAYRWARLRRRPG